MIVAQTSEASKLWMALETARSHLTECVGVAGERMVACRSLVSWVITGQGELHGGETTEVKRCAAEAVIHGLRTVFGAGYRNVVDAVVMDRCDSLR